jgi:O-antigen ligase
MPWLFAAVLRKRSVFKIRWGWLTIELLLLLWACVILVFTYSRAGLFTLLVLVFLSLLFFRSRREVPAAADGSRARMLLRRSGLAALAVLVLALVIFLAGTQNNYFSRLWRYWTEDTRTSSYLEYIAFGQRLIYWQAAYSIYSENPILGAGLGNFAFYFEDHLPERSFQSVPEILRIVTRSQGADRLITSKNLYARLLAETGLVGSAAFFTFTVAVLGCALFLWFSHEPEQKYWGAAGLLGFVVFALTAVSTDSFSIPNMWVVFGLITAAAHIYRT